MLFLLKFGCRDHSITAKILKKYIVIIFKWIQKIFKNAAKNRISEIRSVQLAIYNFVSQIANGWRVPDLRRSGCVHGVISLIGNDVIETIEMIEKSSLCALAGAQVKSIGRNLIALIS